MNKKRTLNRMYGFLLVLSLFSGMAAASGTSIFINEVHYDNSGADTGEAIEIAGPAGTNLSGWSLALYNGNGGSVYKTIGLSGTIPDEQNGFGTLVYPVNGIQNGAPDAIALVGSDGTVVQFLSYEGSFMATNGPANGMTGIDIGVLESSSTPVGYSLQLAGTGSTYEQFTWNSPATSSFGSVNSGQTFATNETIPEFPTLALPLLSIIGLMFLLQRK